MKTNLPPGSVRKLRSELKQRARRLMLAYSIVLGHLAMIESAWTEGFRNPPPGTLNLGRAGGRIAHVDDASAVQQNPANLLELNAPEVQITPSVVYINVDFDSTSGQHATTKEPWKLLPNLFFGTTLKDGTIALGLGLTAPFGISNEWDQKSSAFSQPLGILRYQTPYFAELKSINANPTVSFKLGDRLRLGAGVDGMWSELTLKQFYPWFIFPGSSGSEPDGHLKAKGDGWAVGGNVGLTWLITDKQRLAITYRSPLTVSYDGDFEVSNITPTGEALGATSRSDFDTQIGFPTIIGAGYGIQLTEKIRLEINGEWIQFSRFDTLDLGVGNNAVLLPNTHIPQNWKNTFTIGIGGDWKFASNWVARTSYQFYESPVPDSTFSPTIPDANQNVFTFGLGYHYKKHFVEAAYGADFYDSRRIRNAQNPAFNGDYDVTVHLFSLAYHYSF